MSVVLRRHKPQSLLSKVLEGYTALYKPAGSPCAECWLLRASFAHLVIGCVLGGVFL